MKKQKCGNSVLFQVLFFANVVFLSCNNRSILAFLFFLIYQVVGTQSFYTLGNQTKESLHFRSVIRRGLSRGTCQMSEVYKWGL